MKEINWKHNLISAASGLCGGLMGIGGAFLYIPLSTKFVKIEEKRAHAQALAMGLSSALVGSIVYATQQIHILFAVLLSISGIMGSILGTLLLEYISVSLLRLIFGTTLLIMASTILLKPFLPHTLLPIWILPILGILIGILGGLLGIGGGSIIVPTLLLGYGMDQTTAQGIALLTILPTAAAGFYSHIRQKRVSIHHTWLPALFSALAGALGAIIAVHIPNHFLQILFVLFLGFTALQSIIRSNL